MMWRTVCDCDDCRKGCETIPGYLLPDDLWALSQMETNFLKDGIDSFNKWAEEHLRASPGMLIATAQGYHRLPTIVPKRKEGQRSCHWLTEDGKCSVHKNAPFGCAYFDTHMPEDEANQRQFIGLATLATNSIKTEAYMALWAHLHNKGLITEVDPVEMRRALLGEETDETRRLHQSEAKGGSTPKGVG